jgi:predicted Zn-dependent protease
MQSALDALVKDYFQTENFQALSEADIETYIREHPYTALGHFLLAKKRKAAGKDFRTAAAKAVLYLQDPLWFQYLMNEPVKVEAAAPATPVTQAESRSFSRQPVKPPPIPEPQLERHTAQPAVQEISVTPAPALPSTEQDLFEPYHTIDYFASQGVQLKQEELNNDEFGRQLKSFTEWLKSMKRIQPVESKAPAKPQPAAELTQEEDDSLDNTEVITETMAEVWKKQGHPEKAAAIYKKLSLQNPSKSNYFESKIAQLNS